MVAVVLEECGADRVLSLIGEQRAAQSRAEAATFRLVAEYADRCGELTGQAGVLPGGGGRVLPGAERLVRLGGAGTPEVAEFAAAELGAVLGVSAFAAGRWIADVLDVRHRLPRLWERVVAGQVRVGYARKVAAQTRHLSVQQAGWVDAEVAPWADRLGWGRFEGLLAGKVAAADPAAAAAREAAAREERFARVGRSNDHGQKTLYVRTDAAEVAAIDAVIDYYARALGELGDPDDADRRRVKALLVMTRPDEAARLMATLAATTGTAPDGAQSPRGTGTGESTGATGSAVGEVALPLGHWPGAAQPAAPGRQDSPARDRGEPGEPGSHEPADPQPPDPQPDLPARWHPLRVLDFLSARPEGAAEVFTTARARVGVFDLDWDKILPRVRLYLHVPGDLVVRDADGIARFEGHGPISTTAIRNFLGPTARFTVTPVIDLAAQAPVDGYEHPNRLREAVHLRSPADAFPFASATGRDQDHDHTDPYRHDHNPPPAQTSFGNTTLMVRFHHRIKTHSPWRCKQPFPGIVIWRSPHGRYYLVDHTGTRPLGHDPAPATDPHAWDHHAHREMHLAHRPDITVDPDPHPQGAPHQTPPTTDPD